MNQDTAFDLTANDAVKRHIRILMLEDSTYDAELVTSMLTSAGLEFDVVRVETRTDFGAALENDRFDIVLADYALPSFDGIAALELTRQTDPNLPFVLVSGTLGEEHAIDAMVRGATDYVLKQRLSRLGPAVKRALDEAEERKKLHSAEIALRASERKFRALYDDNPSMFFTVGLDGLIISANQFGAEALGYDRDDLVGRPLNDIHFEDDSTYIQGMLATCISTPGRIHRWEICKRKKNGDKIWVRETARLVDDSDGNSAVLTVCEDTSEIRSLSEQLSFHSSHDMVTGFLNRHEFERQIDRALEDARGTGKSHALCYVDLDQFKVINDICGHAGGDELLKQFSDTLARPVRRDDILARLEGDKFGILLKNCALDRATRIAKEISKVAQGYKFLWGDRTLNIFASIGLIMIEPSSPEGSELLKIADAACMNAKAQGGQRLHIASRQDLDSAGRSGETRWVVRVQEALEARQFELHVQPILPIGHEGGASKHYEILLRMKADDGKLVLPGMFFPVAERYKLAGKIDRMVIEMLAQWINESPQRRMASAMYSLNLSGQSLGDESFQDFAIQMLRGKNISPECICFEITETAAVANMANAMRFIHSLTDVGCKFALDDFGSGLCSFSYLKSFPVHYLKIDGVFVKDIVTDPIDRAMVRSINDIGRVMGKQTVAEFVDSDIILQVLREIGVDYAQGFAIGRPTPLTALDALP